MKKFLSLAVFGVVAGAMTLATPAVSFAGGHHGGGHYHSYHHGWYGSRDCGYYGYGYYGHRYYYTAPYRCYTVPSYYCPPVPVATLQTVPDNLARIRVAVPANAKVWIDNQETAQVGTNRVFESPPLTPDRCFTYTVKAQWCCPDGTEVTRTKQVDVRANACVDLNFLRPAT